MITRITMFKDGLDANQESDDQLYNLINSPEFKGNCGSISSDYDYWYCIVKIYHKTRGRKIAFGSKDYFKNFFWEFFSPNAVPGTTFGLGQMSPLRGLMVDDMLPGNLKVNFDRTNDLRKVYENVLNPSKVVYLIAANIKVAINAYKNIARFDISQNPGITTTLYNRGQEKIVAQAKFNENVKLLKSKQQIVYPKPNDEGSWVLQNLQAIRASVK